MKWRRNLALPEVTIWRPTARSTLNGEQLLGGALNWRARSRTAASPEEVEAVEAEVSESVSRDGIEVEPVAVVDELSCLLSTCTG